MNLTARNKDMIIFILLSQEIDYYKKKPPKEIINLLEEFFIYKINNKSVEKICTVFSISLIFIIHETLFLQILSFSIPCSATR